MFVLMPRLVVRYLSWMMIRATVSVFFFVVLILVASRTLEGLRKLSGGDGDVIDLAILALLSLTVFMYAMLPLCLMAGCMVVVYRLRAGHEWVVLQASGLSPLVLMRPFLWVSGLAVVVVLVVNFFVVPEAARLQSEIVRRLETNVIASLFRPGRFNQSPKLGGVRIFVNAASADGDFSQPFFRDFVLIDDRVAGERRLITAQRGYLVSRLEGVRIVALRGRARFTRVLDAPLGVESVGVDGLGGEGLGEGTGGGGSVVLDGVALRRVDLGDFAFERLEVDVSLAALDDLRVAPLDVRFWRVGQLVSELVALRERLAFVSLESERVILEARWRSLVLVINDRLAGAMVSFLVVLGVGSFMVGGLWSRRGHWRAPFLAGVVAIGLQIGYLFVSRLVVNEKLVWTSMWLYLLICGVGFWLLIVLRERLWFAFWSGSRSALVTSGGDL